MRLKYIVNNQDVFVSKKHAMLGGGNSEHCLNVFKVVNNQDVFVSRKHVVWKWWVLSVIEGIFFKWVQKTDRGFCVVHNWRMTVIEVDVIDGLYCISFKQTEQSIDDARSLASMVQLTMWKMYESFVISVLFYLITLFLYKNRFIRTTSFDFWLNKQIKNKYIIKNQIKFNNHK